MLALNKQNTLENQHRGIQFESLCKQLHTEDEYRFYEVHQHEVTADSQAAWRIEYGSRTRSRIQFDGKLQRGTISLLDINKLPNGSREGG